MASLTKPLGANATLFIETVREIIVRSYFLALAMLLASAAPGLSEDAVPVAPGDTPLCWLSGISFSAGATIRAGEGVMACLSDGRWKSTTGPAAGCLREGKLFALGSSAAIGDAKNGKQTCHNNGTWS